MKETAYLLQAALISLWWVGLATNQSFFNAFQFDEIPPTAFWAFFAPDIVLIAGLSAVRATENSPALNTSSLVRLDMHRSIAPTPQS